MKKRLPVFLILFAAAVLGAAPRAGQAQAAGLVPYDEFFADKALRVDLYQTGDAKEEVVTLDQIYLEGAWPEPPSRLIDPHHARSYI